MGESKSRVRPGVGGRKNSFLGKKSGRSQDYF